MLYPQTNTFYDGMDHVCYIHRLTPPMMVWIMCVATFIKYVGEGRPAWTDFAGAEACRKHWWVNLLYINNVYDEGRDVSCYRHMDFD